jgi:hypothetical protein
MRKRCGVSDSCGDDFLARSAFRGFGNVVFFDEKESILTSLSRLVPNKYQPTVSKKEK